MPEQDGKFNDFFS